MGIHSSIMVHNAVAIGKLNSINPRVNVRVDYWENPEDSVSTIHRTVGICTPKHKASCTRILKYLSPPLWEPQI